MYLLLLLTAGRATATAGFDAATPDASFGPPFTNTADGTIQLWSAIERLRDPDGVLFEQEDFNAALAWPEDAAWAPWIAHAFGTPTPPSGDALLHIGVNEATATGTPILFVPGAGDNGSRGFITMATRMDSVGRPVYALTFAHPHGDCFQQAEVVADAVARVKARTGESRVDLVAHSKGGIAAAIYLSHGSGVTWGRPDYEAVGTPYRGDVRRFVAIATPLGGVDTSFRWPLGNLASLDGDLAVSPTSWSTWYPYGTSVWLVNESLALQDFMPAGGDLFPGQRQLLRRQDAPLPGTMPWLGAYALQPDWATTYEGGLGFVSDAPGIDRVAAEGGDLLGLLAGRGVDPAVELYLLAGSSPLMPNGLEDWVAQLYGQAWIDMATAASDAWAALLADIVGEGLASFGVTSADLQGLAQGKLVLGEVTGESDGLVFLDSALHEAALTARGAVVVESRAVELSHLDLLYASPVTGQLLIDEADADPLEDGWKRGVGERYVAADTLGWVEGVLADPSTTGPTSTGATGTTHSTTGGTGGSGSGGTLGGGPPGRFGCAGSGVGVVLLVATASRRRRRCVRRAIVGPRVTLP